MPTTADQLALYNNDVASTTPTLNQPSLLDSLRALLPSSQGIVNPTNTANIQPNSFEGFGNIAQGVGSLANTWLGFKNLGLSKDAYEQNKAVTGLNIENQARLTNARLAADYEAARRSGGGSRYDSLDSYLGAAGAKTLEGNIPSRTTPKTL